MLIPPYLNPGDKIGLVSTASIIDETTVLPAVQLLTSMGYQVELGKHVFSKFNQFAGTDEERSADLQNMLDNPGIKAIVCSRGGYGSLRTIEKINWEAFRKSPKWIVGFSDVTVIHSTLNLMNIGSIHGVMPRSFLEDDRPTQGFSYLIDALNGKNIIYEILPSQHNRLGEMSGELVGGDLSVLYSLCGTPYDIDTRGKILFIEDLSEYLYHLDRMLMNLKAGGKLAPLAGLVVGSFTRMKDNDTPFGRSVEEIISDIVTDYSYPVVFNFPAGHQPENYALKMGCQTQLRVGSKLVIFKQ